MQPNGNISCMFSLVLCIPSTVTAVPLIFFAPNQIHHVDEVLSQLSPSTSLPRFCIPNYLPFFSKVEEIHCSIFKIKKIYMLYSLYSFQFLYLFLYFPDSTLGLTH